MADQDVDIFLFLRLDSVLKLTAKEASKNASNRLEVSMYSV
jgi:hypothetical protein